MSTENIDLEVNRIKQNISDSYSELSTLGATIPAAKSADNLATCVSSLQTSHIITQNGDNLVTNYGVNINYDSKNTIESLALSQRPGYSDFLVADNGNNTVKFSLGDLKNWINTPTPAATTLHQYDRVDGKATVADFWTDGNGQRYAVCVVDAAYRSGEGMSWGVYGIDTPLPNYTSESAALAGGESGTYNTNVILNTYTVTDYPAFNFVHNACTVTVDGQNFVSCLPNLKELQMLYNDRVTLDTYDTTLSNYTLRSLSSFSFGAAGAGAWSSTENGQYYAWNMKNNNTFEDRVKSQNSMGVCPVIEIPVDENGTVITN